MRSCLKIGKIFVMPCTREAHPGGHHHHHAGCDSLNGRGPGLGALDILTTGPMDNFTQPKLPHNLTTIFSNRPSVLEQAGNRSSS